MAAGESRERLTGPAASEDDALNMLFDGLFEAYAELHQHEQTWRRLPREAGGAAVFSLIDRIYSTIHPVALRDVAVSVGVVGTLADRSSPSDHRLVRAVFRKRRSDPRLNIQAGDCQTEGYRQRIAAELQGYPYPRNFDVRMAMLAKAAGRAKAVRTTLRSSKSLSTMVLMSLTA